MAFVGIYRLSWAQDQTITFSATGDVPYSANEFSVFQTQLNNHNKYSPSAFLVHVGDIFAGSDSCDESRYATIANLLKGLAVPAYIVPGDNETVDCKSPSEGMNHFLNYFIGFEQNFCGALHAEHQNVRPENWAFTMNGVLFMGINNIYGGNIAYQQAADWVRQQLEAQSWQATPGGVRAAVIFAHYEPNRNTLFSTPFRQAAAAFGKPVLFLHGHGHSWTMSYPFPELNILRVQVNKGGAEAPVEVTVTTAVTTNPDSMFIFKRNPWSSKTFVNMPPCANAGPDQTLDTVFSTTLLGSVTDDGDNGSGL